MNFSEWYNSFWGVLTSTHQEDASRIAWNSCKKEILKILNQEIQNADLSYEIVDQRFIEKIENL